MPAGSSGKFLLTPYVVLSRTIPCPIRDRPLYLAIRHLTLIHSALHTNAEKLRTLAITLGGLFMASQGPRDIAT